MTRDYKTLLWPSEVYESAYLRSFRAPYEGWYQFLCNPESDATVKFWEVVASRGQVPMCGIIWPEAFFGAQDHALATYGGTGHVAVTDALPGFMVEVRLARAAVIDFYGVDIGAVAFNGSEPVRVRTVLG